MCGKDVQVVKKSLGEFFRITAGGTNLQHQSEILHLGMDLFTRIITAEDVELCPRSCDNPKPAAPECCKGKNPEQGSPNQTKPNPGCK